MLGWYRQILYLLLEEIDRTGDMPTPEEAGRTDIQGLTALIQRSLTILRNVLHQEDGQGNGQSDGQGDGQKGRQKGRQKGAASSGEPEDDTSDGESDEESEDESEDESMDDTDGEGEDDSEEDGDDAGDGEFAGVWDQDTADEMEETDDELSGGQRSHDMGDHQQKIQSSRNGINSGGGSQFRSNEPDSSLFYMTRYMLSKIVDGYDTSQVDDEGTQKWNARKVVKAAGWNIQRLPQAKDDYTRTVENIYLVLDTSGSVAHWAEKIAAFAAGAAGLVHIFTGTEARPRMRIDRHTPLSGPSAPFPEWDNPKPLGASWSADQDGREAVAQREGLSPYSFEADFAYWVQAVKPPKGSRIIFWGDTEGVGFENLDQLKRLFSPYRVVWLYPDTRERLRKYYGNVNIDDLRVLSRLSIEYPKLQHIGIPVFFEVVTPEALKEVLGKLR